VQATPPIDFSTLTSTEFEAKLGELVKVALLRHGVCVVVAKGERELTLVDPTILDSVPDDAFAEVLLSAWSDEEILTFLELRQRRREARPEVT